MLKKRIICHFDEGEISTRGSTKIIDFDCGVTCEDFSLRRNDKLYVDPFK